MTGRRWAAAVALAVFAAGLWLAVVPYDYKVTLGRLPLSGRCPPAATAAFTRVPEHPFFDVDAGDGLPVELCAPSARRRLLFGVAFAMVAGAVAVAGRTRWRPA